MSLGVVLLHGKWDTPPFAVAPLADALTAAGHRCAMPSLPWALRRLYDAPLGEALDRIEDDIAALRAAGCTRVALCGHSLGGAAALALAARRTPPDALIVLGPGHFPERLDAAGLTTASLATARQASSTARIALVDVHQGRPRRLRIAPPIYLSYFAPDGALHWPHNAARLPAGMPLLWLVGRADAACALGIDYAFARAPAHPRSRYAQIDAGHADTPARAVDQVIDWLAALDL